MRINLLLVFLILVNIKVIAQTTDTWSNVPAAQDDRYTNPKKSLYAGPNGWWNFGEIRVKNTPAYSYKGGLNEINGDFYLVDSKKLVTLFIDFGTENPKNGVYTVAKEADLSTMKVQVSFSDVSNNKIKEWIAKNGKLEIKKVNGFIYFKARDLQLGATGLNNKSDDDISLGFEGAVKIQE